ncbi:MAG TPA: hypothetical protein VK817_09040 [Trebonia sp.]|jgi:hypothetical protein|nr:hypothetical protein [Trebonia sp.]
MRATDEDIIRDLLHRSTNHVRPPASVVTEVVARQRRHDRRRRVASLAATGAALGTAAGVIAVVPGHSAPASSIPAASGSTRPGSTQPAIRLTADQRELYRLSSVAAKQAQDQERYAVMSTEGSDVRDTSVIDSRTGNMWSYQAGTDGSPSGKGYTPRYSPTAAQFAAMPTGLAALRAALIAQWKAQNSPAANPGGWTAAQSAAGKTGHAFPKAAPIVVSDDDMVFQQASDMLWNPLVSPPLRSALYKVLASVPGVTVNSSAHDSMGRPAVEISRVDDSGFPSGKSDGISYATYESAATGAVLESTVTYPPGSDIVTPQDPTGNGTVVDTTVYTSVTWASAVPADPYGG